MTAVRFTVAVGNTPRGAVRHLTEAEASHLIHVGWVRPVEPKPAPEPDSEEESVPAPVAVPKRIPSLEIAEWAQAVGIKLKNPKRIPPHVRQAYIDHHYGGTQDDATASESVSA